jgi:uncharacterized membrane protein YfcA
MEMPASAILLIIAGILLMGFSKAGFGGGLGILTTPLCVLAFESVHKPPAFAIGFILPLLIIADLASVWHYRRNWELSNLKYLLPGVIIGVIIGVQLIHKFSPRQLNIAIGAISMGFVLFQLAKEKIFAAEGKFAPNHTIGVPCGIVAGVTSTFANGAGPVISMFLIPQNLPKKIYVGTNALIFCCINWIKFIIFVPKGIITRETLVTGIYYLPVIPIGVGLGVWLNRRVPERWFIRLVYLFTFLTGLNLVFSK